MNSRAAPRRAGNHRQPIGRISVFRTYRDPFFASIQSAKCRHPVVRKTDALCVQSDNGTPSIGLVLYFVFSRARCIE